MTYLLGKYILHEDEAATIRRMLNKLPGSKGKFNALALLRNPKKEEEDELWMR